MNVELVCFGISKKKLKFIFLFFVFHLDLTSNDINKKIQALFSCPKKWRTIPKARLIRQFFIDDNNNINNNDDEPN